MSAVVGRMMCLFLLFLPIRVLPGFPARKVVTYAELWIRIRLDRNYLPDTDPSPDPTTVTLKSV
jgi:hypothetical protein